MRRFLLSAAIAATTLAVAACDDLTGVSDELVGTYQLRTVDGQSPPVVFPTPSGVITHVDGELELNDDGTFVRTFETSVSGGLPTTGQVTGTWERIGSAVRFERAQNGGRFYGEYTSPNMIIVHDNNETNWEYRR